MADKNDHEAELRHRRNRPLQNEDSNLTATPRGTERKIPPKIPPRESSLPYACSFGEAFLVLSIVRVASALFSNIGDCDEVFNYWEPTHYLQYGYGLQTWEYSPEYSIRSWAYITPHVVLGKLLSIFTSDKIKVFYGIKIIFGVFCAFCEAKFYQAVLDQFGNRVGRYLLYMLLLSAGMWAASTQFLPSTFSMYTTMLAFVYALGPVPTKNMKRSLRAISFFGLGALLAWPFSAAVGIPFIIEELLVRSESHKSYKHVNWRFQRIKRVVLATLFASSFTIPIVLVDYFYYKKFTVVPINIIMYNVFGGKDRGPNLYGTEPWTYYFINGFLNFNIQFVMALLSLPALALTFHYDKGRIISPSSTHEYYPYITVFLRLTPLYLWLGIFVLQPHKEERFLYVIYPLICFNAAMTLFLVRGCLDRFIFQFRLLPLNRDQRKQVLTTTTSLIIFFSAGLSASRVAAIHNNYQAPISVYKHLYYKETNLTDTNREIDVCVGKEWHRFPSHYFLPEGVRLRFIQSDFKGLLPKYFVESDNRTVFNAPVGTWKVPSGFNDRNQENPDHYDKNTEKCDYLIDLDFPENEPSVREPRYLSLTEEWKKVECYPFLDANRSNRLLRAFYLPSFIFSRVTKVAPKYGGKTLEWGQYCLLKKLPPQKITEIAPEEELPRSTDTEGFFNKFFWFFWG